MIKKMFFGTFSLALNVAIYAVIIILAFRLITYSYDFSYEVFGNTAVATESEELIPVQIPDGASTEEVGELLQKKGLIKNSKAFVFHVAISQYNGLIQPGNYELSPSMTVDEMLAIMCGGATQTDGE